MKLPKIQFNVQALSAILMIVAGLSVPIFAPDNTRLIVIGAILATVGGASFSVSQEGEGKAMEKLKPRIQTVCLHIGGFIKSIDKITKKSIIGNIDFDTSVLMVREQLPSLERLVTDLSSITGEKLDVSFHDETRNSIRHIISDFDAGDEKSPARVEETIQRLREAVERESEDEVQYTTESVECPVCHTLQHVVIGIRHGDSAMPTCRNCSARFHAHRGKDGKIFTRLPGASKPLGGETLQPPSM